MKTYYYLPNIWGRDELNINHAFEFKSDRDIMAVNFGGPLYDEFELGWLVEEMASDYLHNHDGWEIANTWDGSEREFAVWDSEKDFIGKFEVLLEYTASFTAWRKK